MLCTTEVEQRAKLYAVVGGLRRGCARACLQTDDGKMNRQKNL